MSAIYLSSFDGFPAKAANTVRLTRRGRIVFLVAFFVVAAAVMVMLSGFAAAGAPRQVRHIQVVPGETLTQIAEQVGSGGDIRDTIAEIEQMNGLPGAALQIGQELVVPVR